MRINDIEINDQVIARDKRRFDYFVPNYLTKHLKKSEAICSVGCGTGYDVELLCRLGYDAYGFDAGARTALWSSRSACARERLRIGFAQERPFGTERFDYVYALEVIEHVGCEDGLWRLLPDYFEIRCDFLESCLDMLKPAGRLLMSTSNRLCPLDIGHGHHYSRLTDIVVRKTRVPLTIPWHQRNFVLSRGDIGRLLQATRYRSRSLIRVVPVSGYLAYSRIDRAFIRQAVERYLKLISLPFLRASFLSPLLIIEIEKA